MSIVDIDREFENSKVKVVAVKDSYKIDLSHRKIGPFKNGEEIEVMEWIAEILMDHGFVKFRDQDMLDLGSLTKIHWKETIPTSRQLPPIAPDFYCMLRRFIRRLSKDSGKNGNKLKDYEKAMSLSKDIVNCRLRKIVSLAASPAVSRDAIRNMAKEEQVLYSALSSTITDWQDEILRTSRRSNLQES